MSTANAPNADSIAVESPQRYGHSLRGTDREAARCVAESADFYANTDLDTVSVNALTSGRLKIELSGTVVIGDLLEQDLPDGYALDGWLSHHNGDVVVELTYDG